jgi:hypothetical protein
MQMRTLHNGRLKPLAPSLILTVHTTELENSPERKAMKCKLVRFRDNLSERPDLVNPYAHGKRCTFVSRIYEDSWLDARTFHKEWLEPRVRNHTTE